VLQVAGSGGTYPVEVLPTIFKVIYPFMPFKYSMDAMRECVCGMYRGTYWECIGMLILMTAVAVIFGLVMYRPMRGLNRMIAESKEKSEIML
jgi:putative membrane protein